MSSLTAIGAFTTYIQLMSHQFAVATALLLVTGAAFAATQGGTIPVPLPLFPPNNWWNTDISAAPVDPSSASFITYITTQMTPPTGPIPGLHPDFGGDAGGGDVYGFPFIIVDGAQTKKTVTFDNPEESDGVTHPAEVSFPFYPIPNEAITMNGWVEGGAPGNIDQRSDDRHILIVDKTNNTLYELYNVWYNGTNWEAGSGAFFNMNTNNRRPDGWTSADASGIAILPGLVRYDEVAGPDEINHAFRVTVKFSNGHVYPASHNAGSTSGALPMGARLRLKPGTVITSYPADVQKIFRAFKKYGLIVVDNGSNMYVSGTYDIHWDNGVLNPAFNALKASDFEVIQRGWAPPVSLVVTFPAAIGSGNPADATVTAYDSNYNIATGYHGTIHFTSTDGAATLPANYTFTAGDAGAHTFPGGFTLRTAGRQTVTARDTIDATITGLRIVTVGPAAPAGLIATAATATTVNLSWTSSAGAAQYEIMRASASSAYATLITTAAISYTDTTVTAGKTYVYKVRAIDASSGQSPFSAPDAATTMFFTDDPLAGRITIIKAVHISELRTAVNLMRAAANLGPASFADPTLAGVPVRKIHLDELRTALTQARAGLGLSAIGYTEPGLVTEATSVKAVHFQELRNGVK